MDEIEDFLDSNLEMYRRRSSVPNSGGNFFYVSLICSKHFKITS